MDEVIPVPDAPKVPKLVKIVLTVERNIVAKKNVINDHRYQDSMANASIIEKRWISSQTLERKIPLLLPV